MFEFLISALFFGAIGVLAPEAPEKKELIEEVTKKTGAVSVAYDNVHRDVIQHRTKGELVMVCPNGEKFWIWAEKSVWGTARIEPDKICS